MTISLDIHRILAATGQIDPVFLDSPLLASQGLDRLLGCRLVAKDETRNPIGSFKGRGTEYFARTALRAGEAVVCASAGNFGQGLARAAARQGSACTVFTATIANPLKVEAMRRLGAVVRLEGDDFDVAKDAARDYAASVGARFVEDGAEAAIAEGAGTLAVELAGQAEFDAIAVPLGNGALLAGVGTALRHLAPHVEIVGVVAERAPAMQHAIATQRPLPSASADTIADGIAVRVPIAATLPLLRACCDAVVSVPEDDILRAMRLSHRYLGVLAEPAGVAGLAAVLAHPARFAGRRVATILCGGNLSAPLRERMLRED